MTVKTPMPAMSTATDREPVQARSRARDVPLQSIRDRPVSRGKAEVRPGSKLRISPNRYSASAAVISMAPAPTRPMRMGRMPGAAPSKEISSIRHGTPK